MKKENTTQWNMGNEQEFNIGDRVYKITGDYSFSGIIISKFRKVSGKVRYVVENSDGILHIFSASNLLFSSSYYDNSNMTTNI